MKGFEPIIDPETGQITGYKTTVGGADTVFPFKQAVPYIKSVYTSVYTHSSWNYCRYESKMVIVPNGCKSFTINSVNGGDTLNATNATVSENTFTPKDASKDVTISWEMGSGNSFGGTYQIASYN